MPLRYVLDEHLRRILWTAIRHHNAGSTFPIDAVRVGDPLDLPLGTLDPEILLWAEREGRILVTGDRNTMAGHLAAHLQAGHHSPGIFMIRPGSLIRLVVDFLADAAYASQPSEWVNAITYIP